MISILTTLRGLKVCCLVKYKLFIHNPDFKRPYKSQVLKTLWGKGENTGNKHFLLFPPMFSTHCKTNFSF